MSNPTSAHRAPAVGRSHTFRTRARRSRIAHAVPAGLGVLACLLLGAVAAADGQVAALVLAVWVALLVVVGVRLSEPPASRPGGVPSAWHLRTNRSPVLVRADRDENGGLGVSRTLPVVATATAVAVLDARPRG